MTIALRCRTASALARLPRSEARLPPRAPRQSAQQKGRHSRPFCLVTSPAKPGFLAALFTRLGEGEESWMVDRTCDPPPHPLARDAHLGRFAVSGAFSRDCPRRGLSP